MDVAHRPAARRCLSPPRTGAFDQRSAARRLPPVPRSTVADTVDEEAGCPIDAALLTALDVPFDPSRDR
jgi:hypothetical protein